MSKTESALLNRIFGPARAMVPGLLFLLALSFLMMAAGAVNVLDPPYRGDRTILFMLAFSVFPAPYPLYGLFSFLLIHALPTLRMKTIFYASLLPLGAAPVISLLYFMNITDDISFGRRLDSALLTNLGASIIISVFFIIVMAVLVFAKRWMDTDSYR
ncbi:MAG: hypothetical protein LBV36_05095 [Chromatiales bacterium]|jgi:hypothetical protein|nr:hypothetical protein [Chromatiales bacterium]